jgi:tetratricopeptide (TPR) repeat protein
MRQWSGFALRSLIMIAACLAAGVSPVAQAAGGQGAGRPDALAQQVRMALGHSKLEDARRLAEAGTGRGAVSTGSREFAVALIEIFEGNDDAAKARLEPLASANGQSDAALELGLLELRHGRRDAAHRWLDPIVNIRTFAGEDDYFRLARAALPANEPMLANDAYLRVKDSPRADIQTAWADFFLARHRGDWAGDGYRKALELDPAWVRAHVGLSRAFAAEVPKGAKAEFEAAVALAPNDPDVLLLTAERAIDVENWGAATAALDRLATVRPGTVQEFAYRAAIAYAEERPADIDASLARVREINPASALGLTQVSERAAEKYQLDQAVEYAQRAVALDPFDPIAQFDLGLYLLRTGDEKGARTALDASWRLDDSNPITKNLGDMLDRLDTYTVVTDGPLTFKFPSDQAAVLKAYALPLGAEAMKTFTEHYGFTPTGPILVEIFSTHDDFAVRTIGLQGITGALGACFGRVVSMDSPSARKPLDFSWQATEWHELAHVYSLQLSKYRVPRWLTEGISVFEEHRRNPAWGREVALHYAEALGRGKTFGVKGLPNAFKNPENFTLAYFEASLVVEHLVKLHGDAGLRTLLLAYADGANDTTAFSKAFGESLDDVDTAFRAFVTQQYGALAEAMKTPPGDIDPKNIVALKARAAAAPGSFVAQLTLGQALVAGGDDAAAKPVLQRAAELAPQDQGNASAHALLAQIAQRAGDNATARKELRALLLYDHDNVDAARVLVHLAAEAKATDDQDYALRLVADLDPFDADIHGPLGRRELAKRQYAAALIEFQAALALGPPNLAEAHTDLGEVYLAMGRRDDARAAALRALKEAPTYARAQDLLLAAMGKS